MHYRAIFISDVHLGTRGSSSRELLEFLRENSADTLYLVGDIVDVWRLKKKFYWPQTHNDVVQKILRIARKGATVVYVPGNHDEAFRPYVGASFGNVQLVANTVHVTADGKQFFVTHGDEFDLVTSNYRWVAILGDAAYNGLIAMNRWVNAVRQRLGMPYWSLSAYAKSRVKSAVNFIGDYEQAVARHCAGGGYDGIICGHIHVAQIKTINGITYANSGDWVESRTALVEDFHGNLSIIAFRASGSSTVRAVAA